ncbi:hypothetical protein MTES_1219 [Microbacterium testaceum StLB037]|uniref:Uncharacterized protein n=1 Tax=Microbacterium testaceum (strain StLB037) TaxID=979556 RepID=E8N6N5_MICTS|nr:hypothetical protein MTES_1219 [Microbacterium testaceum StLB037]
MRPGRPRSRTDHDDRRLAVGHRSECVADSFRVIRALGPDGAVGLDPGIL